MYVYMYMYMYMYTAQSYMYPVHTMYLCMTVLPGILYTYK